MVAAGVVKADDDQRSRQKSGLLRNEISYPFSTQPSTRRGTPIFAVRTCPMIRLRGVRIPPTHSILVGVTFLANSRC